MDLSDRKKLPSFQEAFLTQQETVSDGNAQVLQTGEYQDVIQFESPQYEENLAEAVTREVENLSLMNVNSKSTLPTGTVNQIMAEGRELGQHLMTYEGESESPEDWMEQENDVVTISSEFNYFEQGTGDVPQVKSSEEPNAKDLDGLGQVTVHPPAHDDVILQSLEDVKQAPVFAVKSRAVPDTTNQGNEQSKHKEKVSQAKGLNAIREDPTCPQSTDKLNKSTSSRKRPNRDFFCMYCHKEIVGQADVQFLQHLTTHFEDRNNPIVKETIEDIDKRCLILAAELPASRPSTPSKPSKKSKASTGSKGKGSAQSEKRPRDRSGKFTMRKKDDNTEEGKEKKGDCKKGKEKKDNRKALSKSKATTSNKVKKGEKKVAESSKPKKAKMQPPSGVQNQ